MSDSLKKWTVIGGTLGVIGYYVLQARRAEQKEKPIIIPHNDFLPVLDEDSHLSRTTHNFPPLKNDLILRAARGESTERVPIWCHRQAGRYLPEFREARKQGDFFKICQTPTLATEITLQPLRRYPLDAAIIFSDILVVPQAIGLECIMVPGRGPVFPAPLLDPSHMARLKTRDQVDVKKDLGYVFKALTLTRYSLDGKVPLLGFSGAPWTLMAYMVEGGGAKSFTKARKWFVLYPKESHALLSLLTSVIIEYLILQVEAGAQMLEVFDSWASDVSPYHFEEFLFPYLQQIAAGVKSGLRHRGLDVVPMTIFAKGANYAFERLSQHTEYDCISLDWNVIPSLARKETTNNQTKKRTTLQGNLDPVFLYAPDDLLRARVREMVDSFGTQNYIANLGHGMLPDHSPDKLAVFIDELHSYSEKANAKVR